jgi:hypothetical protein
MLELAERCEKATGPDRELSKQIHAVVEGRTYHHLETASYRNPPAPHFTASLDAAMTLVPEGASRFIFVRVGGRWGCYIDDERGIIGSCDDAATAALALCAAALRARATAERLSR